MTEPMTDAQLAGRLATEAGKLLVAARNTGLFEGKMLGDMGDAVAHQFLIKALALHRPDDAVMSEEGARDTERLKNSRVWIIDPVDGTREYSERRPDWAVHVALAIDNKATLGAVAQPDLAQTYVSDSVTLGDVSGPIKIVVSRTRPPPEAERAAKVLGAELVGMGSAGAKAMAVVRGEVHAYVHSGGQYEWDSCAPVAVAQAAGLFCSRLDGSPLVYNQTDIYLPDLVICRPDLTDRLLQALR